VLGVSLSSDGSTAVSGSGDTTVKVWSVAAGACLHTLTGHTQYVTGVSLSSDGSTAVSGSSDKTVKVWSVAAGACLHTLTGHTADVSGVSLSSDGSTAVSGSWDTTVKVWSVAAGACLHTLTGHTAAVSGVSLSSDGSTAVSGSLDTTVKVWSVAAGACLHTLTGHTEDVYGVSLSSDGSTAVSAGGIDKTVKVWHLEEPDGIDVSNVHEKSLEDLATLRERAAAKRDGITVTEGLDEAMADVGRRKDSIQQTYEREKAGMERRLAALAADLTKNIQACEAEAASLQALMAKESTERKKRGRLSEKVQVLDTQIEKLERATERAETLYEDALQVSSAVIDEDIQRYYTTYTKYLLTPGNVKGRNDLDAAVAAYASQMSFGTTKDAVCWKLEGGGDLQQPDGSGLLGGSNDGASEEQKAEHREQYAEVIRKALRPVVEKMDGVFQDIASAVGAKYERGPPKGNPRLFQKARMSYKNNLRRITDFERGSFVCVDFDTMVVVFEAVTKVVKTVRIKNRFSKGNREATESGGYRDLQLVALLDGGLLLEIQIHLTTFHDLKTMVAKDTDQGGQNGHQRYVQFRQLKERAEFTRQNYLDKLRK
jgi:hypothetical protein